MMYICTVPYYSSRSPSASIRITRHTFMAADEGDLKASLVHNFPTDCEPWRMSSSWDEMTGRRRDEPEFVRLTGERYIKTRNIARSVLDWRAVVLVVEALMPRQAYRRTGVETVFIRPCNVCTCFAADGA